MKPVLPLFIFIDACGWEIVKDDPFAQKFAPHRRKLRSVFGYSSACVPSIVSGGWPVQHRHWNYFVYDPEKSPFSRLRALRWLPTSITSRRIFRRWLSRFIKATLGFRGYFDLYNIPFRHIYLYDFTEKKSPLKPGGMNQGTNIFDLLEQERIPYHVSAPERSEEENLELLRRDIAAERIDFAFLYWPGLDGLLHMVGNRSPEVPGKMRAYERWIEQLLEVAREHYSDVRLHIFSDHGMANCDHLLNLSARLQRLPVRMPEDYVVVYDSTMARFWFFDDAARRQITDFLATVPEGRILPDEELAAMGALFEDRYFGELIFLVKEGVLIVPSHMGERPIKAMHGYHPNDPQSYALLCTNFSGVPDDVQSIPHIYGLMRAAARAAHARNSGANGLPTPVPEPQQPQKSACSL